MKPEVLIATLASTALAAPITAPENTDISTLTPDGQAVVASLKKLDLEQMTTQELGTQVQHLASQQVKDGDVESVVAAVNQFLGLSKRDLEEVLAMSHEELEQRDEGDLAISACTIL